LWLARTIRTERGKLTEKISAGMERRGMKPRPYFRKGSKEVLLGWNGTKKNEAECLLHYKVSADIGVERDIERASTKLM